MEISPLYTITKLIENGTLTVKLNEGEHVSQYG